MNQETEDRELNENELQAIERWQEKEHEMDTIVDDVGKNLDLLTAKLDVNQELIEQQNEAIGETDKLATQANKKFETANKRLKDLIDKYRSPSKLCMDICLIILVIVLVGILIQQIVALKKG